MTYVVHAIFPKPFPNEGFSTPDAASFDVLPGDVVRCEAYSGFSAVTDGDGKYVGVEPAPWVRLSINDLVVLEVPSEPLALYLQKGNDRKTPLARLPDIWTAP